MMTVICSWCAKVLFVGQPDMPTTSTCCPQCAKLYFPEEAV